MPKGMPGQRKVGFTFPAELVERLEEAKWELRKTKAEIVIEAVEEVPRSPWNKESQSATTGTSANAPAGVSLTSGRQGAVEVGALAPSTERQRSPGSPAGKTPHFSDLCVGPWGIGEGGRRSNG